MKTHFKKLRRIMLATAVAGPLLCFAAFVCLAMGYGWWSLIPLLLAGVLFLCVPILGIGRPVVKEPPSGYLPNAAILLTMFWLRSIPEFNALMDRVISGEMLRDGWIFGAAYLWTIFAMLRNYSFVASLSDETIFGYYDEVHRSRVQEIRAPSEW